MTTVEVEALLQGEEGWKPIVFPPAYGAGRSYVGGDADNKRLIVRYFIDVKNRLFVARVYFGPNAQGPPFHAHGGSQAAALDEAMGLGAWVENRSVVAASITIEYLKMLPLGTVTTVEVRPTGMEGKKVWMEGKIIGPEGEIYSKGTGLYIVVPASKLLNDEFHQKLIKEVDKIMGRA